MLMGSCEMLSRGGGCLWASSLPPNLKGANASRKEFTAASATAAASGPPQAGRPEDGSGNPHPALPAPQGSLPWPPAVMSGASAETRGPEELPSKDLAAPEPARPILLRWDEPDGVSVPRDSGPPALQGRSGVLPRLGP